MKERPILFSAPMVRAILSGQKTQTRRVIKNTGTYAIEDHHGIITAKRERAALATQSPYGQPGDRLWVREAFMHEPADYCWEASVSIPVRPAHTIYRADSDPNGEAKGIGWKPSIHMPRNLSRIDLEIIGIRVERLQDISEADARAEGIIDGGCLNCGLSEPCGCAAPIPDARDAFINLWGKQSV